MAKLEDSIEKLVKILTKQTQKSGGAGATEEKREKGRAARRTNTLLEGILKGVTKGMPGAKLDKEKSKFNFGKLLGLRPIGLAGMAVAALGAVKTGIMKSLGLVAKGAGYILKGGVAALGLAATGIKKLAQGASNRISSALSSVWGTLKKGGGKLLNFGRNAVGGIKDLATKASGRISSALSSVWGAAKGGFGRAAGFVSQIGMKAGGGIVGIAKSAASSISGALSSIFNPAGGAVPKTAARPGTSGSLLKHGKGLLKIMGGAAKFLGPIGLAVTAAMAIGGAVSAGMEEYEKSGDLGKAIKEGTAGALESLTFGLVSQKTFSDAFSKVGNYWDSATTGVAAAATSAWDGVKNLIPSSETLTETFNSLKDDLSPLADIKLPDEISFEAFGATITSAATALKTSFKNITGIDVDDTLKSIGDGVSEAANKLLTGFENVTGINVDATLKSIGDGVSDAANKLNTAFFNITGINIGEKLGNIKTKVIGAFENIELPTFSDISDKLTDISGSIVGAFSDVGDFFSGIFSSSLTKSQRELLDQAEKAGLYDEDWIGDSEIDKKALKEGVESGKVNKAILQAILADKDLSEEDTEFTENLLKLAKDGNSLSTHDHGLHDKFDRIFPKTTQNVSALMNSFPGTTNAGNQINVAGVTRMARDQAPRDAAIINAPATNIAPVTTTNAHYTNTSMVGFGYAGQLSSNQG